MSFVLVWFTVERYLYYTRIKLDEFQHPEALNVALTNRLTTIASIGSNAPYIGLLGTVLGILIAFYDMGQGGKIEAGEIMLGLALALKATALGLVVAIPAILFYNGLGRKVDINVIPFIDIMLVLLAIVLTTASFISQGVIDLDLPEAQSAEAAGEQTGTMISVSADGSLFLDEAPLDKDALANQLAQMPKSTEFSLYVDKAVRFEHFITVIDLLKLNDLNQLTIRTLTER
ncbi:unnamed protein product [Cyprideis torosa]|uniref:Uncharacterized protein n=1 Tax=Cyprideis torosa TaxID=163714 RepID=A0A7R8WQL0_9CRUS|nr:unnamed protein product [Cyprideis torosa]CAG0906772.1 unnamed protein product [Cyprideis torosa]